MNKIVIKNITGRDISLEDFKEAEELLGYTIPKGLKQFLIEHNGGDPRPGEFETLDGKLASYIVEFMSLDTGENSIYEEIEGVTLAGWILPHLITFAITPEGNRLVLSCDGKDINSVYFWEWTHQKEEEKPSYKHLSKIASSFEDFINSLT